MKCKYQYCNSIVIKGLYCEGCAKKRREAVKRYYYKHIAPTKTPRTPTNSLAILEVIKNSNLTLQKIGEKFGLSRQRVHQIKKAYYAKVFTDFE